MRTDNLLQKVSNQVDELKSQRDSLHQKIEDLEKFVKTLGDQCIQLEQRVEELTMAPLGDDDLHQVGTDIYKIAIAKLQPTSDDVVFVWLPDNKGLTDKQVHGIGQKLGEIIEHRFRFVVAVKNGMELEVVKGKHSPILLPS